MHRPWVLATVRWVLTATAVALLVLLMWHLSRWQWHKHVARDGQISRQEANLRAPVVTLGELIPGPAVPTALEWRRVRLEGRYDRAHQIVVTLRTVDGVGGSEVLTPLRLADGATVLVDRGFYGVPDSAPAGSPGIAPAAPAGPADLVGYLRLPEGRSRPPAANQGQPTLTQIDPAAAAEVTGHRVLDGYVTLVSSSPAQPAGLSAITPPTYDTGPYLSYSVQWIIFCVIAVGGLVLLGVDEFGGGKLRTRLREADAASAASRSGPVGPRPVRAPAAPVRSRQARPTTVLAGGSDRSVTDARFFEGDDYFEGDDEIEGDDLGDARDARDARGGEPETSARPSPPVV